jgi:hypothetical protein
MLLQADVLQLTAEQRDSLAAFNRWFTVRLDSIWTPAVRVFSTLPANYSHGDAYGVFLHARHASYDLMLNLAPRVSALLSGSQRRRLPPAIEQQLDVRYLRMIRSSSAGFGGGIGPMSTGR